MGIERLDEQKMIDAAVADAGGSYAEGIAALQRRLMKIELAKGLTSVAAQRQCKALWPVIFGV